MKEYIRIFHLFSSDTHRVDTIFLKNKFVPVFNMLIVVIFLGVWVILFPVLIIFVRVLLPDYRLPAIGNAEATLFAYILITSLPFILFFYLQPWFKAKKQDITVDSPGGDMSKDRIVEYAKSYIYFWGTFWILPIVIALLIFMIIGTTNILLDEWPDTSIVDIRGFLAIQIYLLAFISIVMIITGYLPSKFLKKGLADRWSSELKRLQEFS
jgi:hypothetical protein